jgi:glycosyltransferase involved in cell wall biosynthesis
VVKRIAFAVPGSLETPTGGYAYDRRMIAELERLGWDIELIDVGSGFPWPNEATMATARTGLLKIPGGRPIAVDGLAFGALPDVASELARQHPLLALVHHPLALEWGLSADQIDSLHRMERAALACAQGVVVTSPATARIVASDYGVPPGRITVARPGNDPVPRARGSRSGALHLLSVGAVVPRKGFDVLIAALAALSDLPWKLTIAGDLTRDAKAAARLHSDISRHELTDRIAVLGAISSEQLASLYDTADLFVLSSYFEGYGMAYSEALAYGLPVIGTNAGAIAETIPDNAGMLVDAGDTNALTEALRSAITDPALRLRLADAALAASRHLPTWSQSAQIFSAALERLT